VSILGAGNDERCVVVISERRGSLEILYNVMNGQSAMIKELIAPACCDNSTERAYFRQMIKHIFLTHQITAHIYLKFESYNLQSKNIKVLILGP